MVVGSFGAFCYAAEVIAGWQMRRDPFRVTALFFLPMDYKSKRWLALRARVLRRDKGLCREALRYGRRVEATTVHHVYPVEDYPELQWAEWNLISVSQQAHNSFHDRSTGKLTPAGLAWQKRVSPPSKVKNGKDPDHRAGGLFPTDGK